MIKYLFLLMINAITLSFFYIAYLFILVGIDVIAYTEAILFQLANVRCFAKIKFTAIVAEIRNKLNGNVFSRNSSGAYIRTKVTPVNPNTSFQSNVRADFTTVAQAWRDLTEAERNSWNQGVVSFSHTDIFGDNVPLSGFGLHQQLNLNLLAIGAAVITAPPLPGAVFNFTSSSLAAAFALQTVTLTYAPAIPATETVILKATAPLSAGKSFVKSELRQIDTIVAADVSPFSSEAEYITKFGAVGAVGSKVFYETKAVVTLTGLAGGRRLISAIVAA